MNQVVTFNDNTYHSRSTFKNRSSGVGLDYNSSELKNPGYRNLEVTPIVEEVDQMSYDRFAKS